LRQISYQSFGSVATAFQSCAKVEGVENPPPNLIKMHTVKGVLEVSEYLACFRSGDETAEI
jgi:hypothetical protein